METLLFIGILATATIVCILSMLAIERVIFKQNKKGKK